MTPAKLITTISELGGRLYLDKGELRLKAPKGSLSDELRAELTAQKDALIEFLSAAQSSGAKRAVNISRADRNQPLLASFSQQRLWFLDQLDPGNATYNVPWPVLLAGQLDIHALQKALDTLVARHESLRTTFGEQDDIPVQIISASLTIAIEQFDLHGFNDADIRAKVNEISHQPFDLQRGPLLRVAVLQIEPDRSILILCMHHIICDAWSQGLLFHELAWLYDAYRNDKPDDLPSLPLQYADYAVWQRAHLTDEVLEKQLMYWKDQLGDAPPLLDLPLDRPRPAVETHNGATVSLEIDAAVATRLEALARSSGNTLFTVMLSAFNLLLSRYSGEQDLVVGTPVSGRNRTELEGIIGFFLNTLAIRADITGNPSFKELVERARKNTLHAFTHQDLPFEKLVEELQPVRNLSYAPFFQVLFVFNQVSESELQFGDLKVSQVLLDYEGSKFDLQLTINQIGAGLSASILYNADLFDRATIQRMLKHFHRLLAAIAANPDQGVDEYSMLGTGEEQQIISDFNATAENFPIATVVDLFEKQAERTPESQAVIAGNITYSYAHINRRANRLARYLRSSGISTGALVGICAERGPDVPLAILAVLKAGAAYVPIDPAYPAERIAYILDDCGADAILTQSQIADKLPQQAAVTIDLDSFDWDSGDDGNLGVDVKPNNPLYAIYTSGSTGQPKGVLLPQAGLANLLQWQAAHTTMSEAARTLQFASFSFDVSFQELFSTWLQGGTLVMIDEDMRRDLPALARFIASERIERLFLPYAALQPLVECFLNEELQSGLALRDVVVAGEQLQITPTIRQLFMQLPRTRLHNQYGPSETHVVTTYTLNEDIAQWPDLPPIGRPIANTRAYVLDERLKPLPVGIAGELYIGGIQVALGYLHRPEITADKFIHDPFAQSDSERMYRTGDRVRFLADGNLEYLGRTDDQVKWRGFRIEPGEIEAALAADTQVQQATVVLREDEPGDKRLVAYLVADKAQTIDENALRTRIKQHLPEYMLPSLFVLLEQMPLTPSGKVARRNLPVPSGKRTAADSGQLPVTELHKHLAGIWEKLLKVDHIGIDDNFFDLGGHSLLTIKLMRQIEAITGEQLTIADIFENPTIRELSLRLPDTNWDMQKIATASVFARLWRRISS